MAGGAPTLYDPKYCAEIIDFFTKPMPLRIEYKREYNTDGTVKREEPIIMPPEFPMLQDFATAINVHRDTLNEWSHKHKEFSDAIAHAKALQESVLVKNGLSGGYNSQFAQFFAKNNLGYKDKQEIEANVTVKKLEDVL